MESASWGIEQAGKKWSVVQEAPTENVWHKHSRLKEQQAQSSWTAYLPSRFEEHQRGPGALQLMAVFCLQMDELQGSVKQLQAFMDESTQCLQKVSVQLGKCA
jgi:hypothetical protein